jgi:hypothetical protein
VAAVVGVLAVLMIVGFFFFSWMEVNFMGFDFTSMAESMGQDADEFKFTALEIWTGRNNGQPLSLKLDKLLSEDARQGDVRLLDRFLIVIPVGAIVLLWLAWMYGTRALAPLTGLAAMSIVGLLLLLFPYAWKELSENNWENAVDEAMTQSGDFSFESSGSDAELGSAMFGGMFMGMFQDWYSSGEQVLLAALALVACVLGAVLEMMARNPAWVPRRV